jgi:hypothetical protein
MLTDKQIGELWDTRAEVGHFGDWSEWSEKSARDLRAFARAIERAAARDAFVEGAVFAYSGAGMADDARDEAQKRYPLPTPPRVPRRVTLHNGDEYYSTNTRANSVLGSDFAVDFANSDLGKSVSQDEMRVLAHKAIADGRMYDAAKLCDLAASPFEEAK